MAGFAGYKAGMTHVMMIDDRPRSLTEGMEISLPVTVLEVPPMNVVAVRAYENYNGGLRPAGEAWAENLNADLSRALTVPKKTRGTSSMICRLMASIADVRVLVHTNPMLVTGIPKKVPELMEMPITTAPWSRRLELARRLLGQQVPVSSVFELGDLLDVSAVTKGKGTQGPVRRWGICHRQEEARPHRQTAACRQPRSLASITHQLASSPAGPDGISPENRVQQETHVHRNRRH